MGPSHELGRQIEVADNLGDLFPTIETQQGQVHADVENQAGQAAEHDGPGDDFCRFADFLPQVDNVVITQERIDREDHGRADVGPVRFQGGAGGVGHVKDQRRLETNRPLDDDPANRAEQTSPQ